MTSRNSSARPVTGASGTMKPASASAARSISATARPRRGAAGRGSTGARRPARPARPASAARAPATGAGARLGRRRGAGSAARRDRRAARGGRRRNRRARRRARAATGGCAWSCRSSRHRAALPEFDQDQHRLAGRRAPPPAPPSQTSRWRRRARSAAVTTSLTVPSTCRPVTCARRGLGREGGLELAGDEGRGRRRRRARRSGSGSGRSAGSARPERVGTLGGSTTWMLSGLVRRLDVAAQPHLLAIARATGHIAASAPHSRG